MFHLLRWIFSVSSFATFSFNSLISRLRISSLEVSAAVKFLALINLISARFVGRLHSGQVLPVLNHWSIQLWPKRCPQGKDEIAWGPGCEYFYFEQRTSYALVFNFLILTLSGFEISNEATLQHIHSEEEHIWQFSKFHAKIPNDNFDAKQNCHLKSNLKKRRKSIFENFWRISNMTFFTGRTNFND